MKSQKKKIFLKYALLHLSYFKIAKYVVYRIHYRYVILTNNNKENYI